MNNSASIVKFPIKLKFSSRTGSSVGLLIVLAGCLLLAIGARSFDFKTSVAGAQGIEQLRTLKEVQGAGASGDFERLLAKAQAEGAVRVVVGLRGAFQPEGRLNVAAAQTQRRDIARAQTALLGRLPADRVAAVKRFAYIPFLAMEVDAVGLERLRGAPEVATIEEDAMLRTSLAESVALVGAPAAWASGYAGAGQTVAILDTGVDKAHPFLSGKVVSEACYSTSGSLTTTVCPGGVAPSTAPGSGVNCSAPGCEHGTHVAGAAAGKSATFSGVARDANIIAIQVFSRVTNCPSSVNCVIAFNSDVLLGLQRVYELRSSFNIAAANLSLGGLGSGINCDATETAYKAAIDLLRSVEIATIVAAGNSGNRSGMGRPACVSTAISVGSTGDGSNGSTVDAVSSFSDNASFLNLLAPGEWINSSVPGGTFDNFRGTSQATPHVAGAWAVLKSKTPQATVSQIHQALADTGLAITDPRNGLIKPRIRVDAAAGALASTPCSYALASGAPNFNRSGGAGAVNVTATSGCAWTARSNVPWITQAAGGGNGNGSVNYTVAPNAGLERSGTLSIAGQTFIVSQASAPALALDDGVFENFIGLRFGGKLCAVNRITPASYPTAIDMVGIHFQSLFGLSLDKDISVIYGLNPSGAGDVGSVSFQSIPGKVRAWDQFNLYSIPPMVANSGDFVVGFCVQHSSTELPVQVDQTPSSKRRSFISANDGAYQLIDGLGSAFAGNFGIRALLSSKHVLATGLAVTAESCGARNNAVDPGETVTVNLTLRNIGVDAVNNLVATLQTGGGVTAPSGAQTYGAMAANGSSVTRSFSFTAGGSCGAAVTAALQLQDGTTNLGAVTLNFPLGAPAAFSVTNNHSYAGAPAPIPDINTVEVPLTVSDAGLVNNLKVRVRLNHSFVSDIDISLVGPDGTTVELSTDNGGSGANYGSGANDCSGSFTVFDDAAPTSIRSASAPFAGSFKPQGELSVFNGKPVNGVWKLRITDDAPADSGTLGCWQLEIARQQAVCCGSTCPVITGVSPATAIVGSQVMISGANLTGVTAVKFANNATATFTVNSATQITATIPAGARPGPLTISRSDCPDFQIDFTPLTLEIAPAAAAALTVESCAPANQAIDPGETVTVNFPLKNQGTGDTTNLVATLQPTGGVTAPSGPQTYGVLSSAGFTTTRSFTFTASGACGGAITATLQLQDGALNLGTVSFNLLIGTRTLFAQNFDGVTAPALPSGWTATVATGGAAPWRTTTTLSDTAPNNAFTLNPSFVSDIRLETPTIAITGASARLTFRNNYELENGFDGGALEIAVGSGAFTDIIAAGGGFVSGGYNSSIPSGFSSPLNGRQVWSGNSGGYITTAVNLPATTAGQNIKLRWRLGSSASTGAPGWHIDSVAITVVACATNCGPVCHSVTGLTPTIGAAGSTVTITGANFTGATAVKFANNVTAQFTVNSDTQITTTVPAGAVTGPITISKAGCPDAQTAVFTVCSTITITPASLPAGALNTAYNQTLTASGGAAPYSFTLSAGSLPNGLTLSSSGALSGPPAQIGSFNFTVRATAANGCAGTQVYTLTINPRSYEADVAPRPNGDANGTITVSDWTQVGRFVSGLDTAANGGEFQRADCAPRGSLGDGRLTASDWVQAGRYASGEDPAVAAGGPTSPVPLSITPGAFASMIAAQAVKADEPRLLRVVADGDSSSSPGATRAAMVELEAQGDETALGLSLLFNPSEWRFISAEAGDDAQQAAIHVNANEAARGRIGLLVALPAGGSFNAGVRQILTVKFAAVSDNHAQPFTLGVADGPVAREIVNREAVTLPARYEIKSDSQGAGALANVSAASMAAGELASGQIVAAFGVNLATRNESAMASPPPYELGGTRVVVTDSQGIARPGALFFVSPMQVNYQIPPDAAEGVATVTITSGDGTVSTGLIEIATIAPGLFAANNDGRDVATPIDLGSADDQIYLTLFGTGLRNRGASSVVTVKIGGTDVPVLYAGAAPGFVGLDQINLGPLPRSLAGRGEVDVLLIVDGKPANTVRVNIQ